MKTLAVTKKTSTKKATAKTTAKTVAKKATATTAKAVEKKATTATAKATKKATVAETQKYVYAFFNCNENKDATSMNVRYNNEVFMDTEDGRKSLWKKVESEAKAGRVNIADSKAVKNDILKGEPTDASEKLQYGDIERLVIAG